MKGLIIVFLAFILLLGCSPTGTNKLEGNKYSTNNHSSNSEELSKENDCYLGKAEREDKLQKELMDPPSLNISILEKSDKEILKWLVELDNWPFQAVPLSFNQCDIDIVQKHLTKLLPEQHAIDFLKQVYGFNEEQNEYFMKNGDNHPDLAAWYEYQIDILRDESSNTVTLFLYGKNNYEIEDKIGFEFEVINDQLKILKFKYIQK